MKSLTTLWARLAVVAAAAALMAATAFAQTNVGISVEPDTLDFLQVKGGKFATASFVIRNTMDSGRISGSVISPGGVFQIENGSGSFDLGPGEIQIVSLRFTPSSHRLFADSLAITHNISGLPSPIYVHLRGTGSDSIGVGGNDSVSVSITPEMLNFGATRVGATMYRQVTIRNTSDSVMLLGSVTAGAATGPFSIQSGSGPFVLNAGESRVVTVAFSPTAMGTFNGVLTVAYNSTDSAGVKVITLQGTGIEAENGGSDSMRLSIQPGNVNFGSLRVGRTSQRSVMLMNLSDSGAITGTATLTATAGGPFSVTGGTGAFNLNAGGTQMVSLQFAPTAPGIYRDTLVVGYMANGSLQLDTVRVMGIAIDSVRGGVSASVRANPRSIDFGTVRMGQFGQRQITLTNEGQVAVTGTVSNPAEPFFVPSGAGTFSLMPGQSQPVLITYAPSLPGTFSDNLLVAYATLDSSYTTYVEMTGVAAAAQSSVNDREIRALAAGYTLGQNHPNPFSGSTTIEFSLPKSGDVLLRIFNTRGEEVATLLNEQLDAGTHQILWNADGMASGVYVYQMQSGDAVVAKRLTLTN